MKYLKLFENFDTPFPEEEDLIDYLQEFFDKYSIRLLDDIDDEYNDTNNYMIYHGNEASLSIDIYNDPDKEVYNQSDVSLYNIIIYMRYVIQ